MLGSGAGASARWYWLFLEDVREYNKLSWSGIDAWLTAFRWLARMHVAYYGREEELRALGCLGDHGAAFYRFFALNARAVLQRYFSGTSSVLRSPT